MLAINNLSRLRDDILSLYMTKTLKFWLDVDVEGKLKVGKIIPYNDWLKELHMGKKVGDISKEPSNSWRHLFCLDTEELGIIYINYRDVNINFVQVKTS